jgi:hypothetical protein
MLNALYAENKEAFKKIEQLKKRIEELEAERRLLRLKLIRLDSNSTKKEIDALTSLISSKEGLEKLSQELVNKIDNLDKKISDLSLQEKNSDFDLELESNQELEAENNEPKIKLEDSEKIQRLEEENKILRKAMGLGSQVEAYIQQK